MFQRETERENSLLSETSFPWYSNTREKKPVLAGKRENCLRKDDKSANLCMDILTFTFLFFFFFQVLRKVLSAHRGNAGFRDIVVTEF